MTWGNYSEKNFFITINLFKKIAIQFLEMWLFVDIFNVWHKNLNAISIFIDFIELFKNLINNWCFLLESDVSIVFRIELTLPNFFFNIYI